MNFKLIVDFIITSSCSAVSLYIGKNFSLLGFELVFWPFLSALITFVLLRLFVKAICNNPSIRSLYDPRQKFEGYWIESTEKDGNIFHSLCEIKYNWYQDTYSLSGIALNAEGQYHATWKSTVLDFDTSNNELKYIYNSRVLNNIAIEGYARIIFHRSKNGELLDGKGYFVDMGIDLQRCDFSVVKLTEEIKKELMGLSDFDSPFIREELIKKYHATYGKKIMNTRTPDSILEKLK